MIKVLKYPYLNDDNSLCVGTHNGIFHCDEVIAISILNILYDGKKDINVIRTRNLEILNEKATKDNCIDFVVFPYPDGGYALQCVPPSKENLFAQRISLPDEWAGETINLPQISKINSATFCHRGKFFARALDFNDIIKMCEISTDKHYNENTSAKELCKKQ